MGTFENKVDRKGRVSVPAPFRQSLATSSYQGIVAFRSHRSDAVESCDIEFMNQLNGRADALDLFSDEHDDLVFTLFADAFQLPFDGEGRIILPPALATHATITDRAAFVGKGNTFQIWQPETLAERKEDVRARARAQGISLPRGDGGSR
jgi:MraZ protein